MKINTLLLAIAFVFSTASFAGESDIMFSPDTNQEVVVSGDTTVDNNSKDTSFTATSENAESAFAQVKDQIETGFAGSIRAVITDLETQEAEELDFSGLYDDAGNCIALYAQRQDGTVLVWKI